MDPMADDEIEKLLREINATSSPPASTSGKQVAKPENSPARRESGGSAGGRLAFAGIAAVGMGAAGWFSGLVLPFLGAGSVGVGAAFGAGLTALIVGPPRWFSS